MSYAPSQGGDLRSALAEDHAGRLGWYRQGRGIALDVARGVASLHSHKITHRDLKSPNILLDKVRVQLMAGRGLGLI